MNFFNVKKTILYLLLFIPIILNIAISVYEHIPRKEEKIVFETNEVEIKEEQKEEQNELAIESYYVDIKGAVKNPGVYLVNKGTIINDVINLAGGLTKNASTKNINLSYKTTSSMVIYIYTNNELIEEKTINTEPCICNEIKECIDNKESIIIEEKKEEPNNQIDQITSNKININTATKEELQSLNGIGEQKALSIIEYRETNGNFKSIEEIKNVSGIGDSAYEKIKDYITI